MNTNQAVNAALKIQERYLAGRTPRRHPEGIALDHLCWMVEQMANGLSEGKTMRWLGYIQGVLVAQHVATLDEMKELSRKAAHDES